MQKGVIELKGVVVKSLSNATFEVKIDTEDGKDHTVICHVSGKIRMNSIRILPGDMVTIEMTPYDLTKGRITYRHPAGKRSRTEDSNEQNQSVNPTPAEAEESSEENEQKETSETKED